MEDVRKKIIDFVEREYKLPDNSNIEDFNFIESGYVDSMGLVQFVAILEEDFNIEFTKDELLSDEFKTIGGLEKIILNKIEK